MSDEQTIREAVERGENMDASGFDYEPALAALDRMAAKVRAWDALYGPQPLPEHGWTGDARKHKAMDVLLAEEREKVRAT